MRRIGGGDINEAFRVVLADGREAFVKTRADAEPGEYAAEAGRPARGSPSRARCAPRACSRWPTATWRSSGSRRAASDAAGAEELGRGLAATHAAGVPRLRRRRSAARGAWRRRRGFGSLRAANEPAADWPTFYAERRLRPLARWRASARRSRAPALGGGRARVRADAPSSPGPRSRPRGCTATCGRATCIADADGRPWLIDPSAYGGHREVDLAMLRLFGAPSERVFDAYERSRRSPTAGAERVGLYQLLPLLVHALLFGGSYRAPRPTRVARATLSSDRRRRSRRPRPGAPAASDAGRRGAAHTLARAAGALYLLARVAVARHYRRAADARRGRARPGELAAAAAARVRAVRRDAPSRRTCARGGWRRRRELLVEQRAIPVRDVARLVGYRQASHFARAFRRRYGLAPARFRARALRASRT